MILLDANVVSEPMRSNPDRSVTLPRNSWVQWEPAKRKVDKRLTKRFFEGDPRKVEK